MGWNGRMNRQGTSCHLESDVDHQLHWAVCYAVTSSICLLWFWTEEARSCFCHINWLSGSKENDSLVWLFFLFISQSHQSLWDYASFEKDWELLSSQQFVLRLISSRFGSIICLCCIFLPSCVKNHLLKNLWLQRLTLECGSSFSEIWEVSKRVGWLVGFHLFFMSSEAIHYWTPGDIGWVNISLSGQHVGHVMNQNRKLSIGDFSVCVIKTESPSTLVRMGLTDIFTVLISMLL